MPKYLYVGTYTAEGAKGVLKDGGSKRRDVASSVISSVGGTLEQMYYGFGSDDFYIIADMPNHAAMSAVALTVGGSGAIRGRTTVLMEPEELDDAAKLTPSYSPPGS
ncbi:MAG: GYD domain-containing protein [Candidatus Limnocylindria bacterium]